MCVPKTHQDVKSLVLLYSRIAERYRQTDSWLLQCNAIHVVSAMLAS